MDPVVASALAAATGTVIGVVGTVAVAIVGFPGSRSANRETIAAAKATPNETIAAARESSTATIEATHADILRTLDTTRGGQIADLYSRAIEQLGSDELDVRIGGIYALERVARDSAADHPTVMEVLRSFIREHSRELQTSTDPGSLPRERSKRADVNAALTVIERTDTKRDIRSIDLAGAGLTAANLPGAILPRAILPRADPTGVNFGAPGEDLRVTLRDANLSDAKLADAHLMKADLTGAILVGANLRRVDLSGAKLVGAILADADLQDADLTRADLRGAALTRADLRGADLTGALWAVDVAAPEGWVRDAGSGRLSRSNATASSL